MGGPEGQRKTVGRKIPDAKKATGDKIESEPRIQALFPVAKIKEEAEKAHNENYGRDEQVGELVFIMGIAGQSGLSGENVGVADQWGAVKPPLVEGSMEDSGAFQTRSASTPLSDEGGRA